MEIEGANTLHSIKKTSTKPERKMKMEREGAKEYIALYKENLYQFKTKEESEDGK